MFSFLMTAEVLTTAQANRFVFQRVDGLFGLDSKVADDSWAERYPMSADTADIAAAGAESENEKKSSTSPTPASADSASSSSASGSAESEWWSSGPAGSSFKLSPSKILRGKQ